VHLLIDSFSSRTRACSHWNLEARTEAYRPIACLSFLGESRPRDQKAPAKLGVGFERQKARVFSGGQRSLLRSQDPTTECFPCHLSLFVQRVAETERT
jgi:hypothetical protein